MNVQMKICAVLLVLAVSPLHSQTQDIESEEARNAQELMRTLAADADAFHVLHNKIETANESDRELLYYRLDDRVFRILAAYDTMANQLAGLPEDAPQRVATTQQLAEIGKGSIAGMDAALFGRIDDIQQRVSESNARIAELSGALLFTTQAYVQSLDSVRIRYYESLSNHVVSREKLGRSYRIYRCSHEQVAGTAGTVPG